MVSQASRLNRLPAAERGITIGDFLVPVTIGERMSSRVRHIALVVAGALIIALSANVSIPVPGSPVPITGQTFSVLLVGGALGARRGVLATLLYLVMGLFLPVYADHKQGIGIIGTVSDGHVVLGATGGYLLGFVLASGLVGRLAELGWDRRFVGAFAMMALGDLVIYVIGVPWLMAATGMDVQTALDKGVYPFVLGDVIKLALAAGLFPIAWWVVGRSTEER
jgi:biotin transport system substrate-specific component